MTSRAPATLATLATRAALATLALSCCLALISTACPGAAGAGPGEGEGEGAEGEGEGNGGPVDVGCARDEECGAGEICDLTTSDCVAGLDCTANAGLCDFCGDFNADCGFGTLPAYCSSDAGVCRRQQGECGVCDDDTQCADGPTGLPSVCAPSSASTGTGFCAAGCGACPAGFACAGGGCVPAVDETGVDVCASSLPCGDGGGCPQGQTCTELGVCLALCTRDADCPAGDICVLDGGPNQSQCVQGCPLGETAIQDGVDVVCHADGRFAPPCPTEGATTGCPTGTECDAAGVCQRAGCQSDDECPLIRTFCDVASGTCIDGCNSVDDCGSFELCEGINPGQCVPEGCIGKEISCDLGEWCCGAELFEDASSCPAEVGDGDCFIAPDPWCRTCEDNDDCADIAANDPFGQPSLCFELTRTNASGQEESLGKFCSVGCNDNGDCPRGVDCVQDLPTEEEGVTAKGCLDLLCPNIAGAR